MPDAAGHWLNQSGMCPWLASIATAFSSKISLARLWPATFVSHRSCQSFPEFEEGRGQLACIRSRISTMSSDPQVPSNSIDTSVSVTAVPVDALGITRFRQSSSVS